MLLKSFAPVRIAESCPRTSSETIAYAAAFCCAGVFITIGFDATAGASMKARWYTLLIVFTLMPHDVTNSESFLSSAHVRAYPACAIVVRIEYDAKRHAPSSCAHAPRKKNSAGVFAALQSANSEAGAAFGFAAVIDFCAFGTARIISASSFLKDASCFSGVASAGFAAGSVFFAPDFAVA